MPYLTPDDNGGAYLCRRLRFRGELAHVMTGALELLTHPSAWEQFGGMTPEQAAELALEALNYYLESDAMCHIGTLVEYITDDPPEGVLALDGTTYLGADYPDLYARIAAEFKDGSGNFTLPDARGRSAVFSGAGAGLTARSIGDSFGAETVTLTVAELPAHDHSYQAVASDLVVVAPGEVPASSGISAPTPTSSTGGGGAHENMPPGIVWHVGVWWK
jgi:microcystin-dependent protein